MRMRPESPLPPWLRRAGRAVRAVWKVSYWTCVAFCMTAGRAAGWPFLARSKLWKSEWMSEQCVQRRNLLRQSFTRQCACAHLLRQVSVTEVFHRVSSRNIVLFWRLKASDLQLRFCTNESQQAREAFVAKLQRLGFDISVPEVFSPAPAAVAALKDRGLRPHLLVYDGNAFKPSRPVPVSLPLPIQISKVWFDVLAPSSDLSSFPVRFTRQQPRLVTCTCIMRTEF